VSCENVFRFRMMLILSSTRGKLCGGPPFFTWHVISCHVKIPRIPRLRPISVDCTYTLVSGDNLLSCRWCRKTCFFVHLSSSASLGGKLIKLIVASFRFVKSRHILKSFEFCFLTIWIWFSKVF
jgi:hypothetical protein